MINKIIKSSDNTITIFSKCNDTLNLVSKTFITKKDNAFEIKEITSNSIKCLILNEDELYTKYRIDWNIMILKNISLYDLDF